MEVRILMSAANAGDMFDLRCLVRERLVEWLAREHPQALARDRVELSWAHRDGAEGGVRTAA
jgi:hypothetical protein